jgi:hypothetical protein
MNSSIEMAKAIITPARMPGSACGTETVRKRATAALPRSIAAFSWLRSSPSRRTRTRSVTTGRVRMVWPAMIVHSPR